MSQLLTKHMFVLKPLGYKVWQNHLHCKKDLQYKEGMYAIFFTIQNAVIQVNTNRFNAKFYKTIFFKNRKDYFEKEGTHQI